MKPISYRFTKSRWSSFSVNIPDRCCIACEREFTAISSQSFCAPIRYFCVTIFARQSTMQKLHIHILYSSAMSLSPSSSCFFCHQRIGRIRFLPCSSENATLVWQNNETGVTQGKMNMHVCHTFCFSRTVTRLRKMQVSMRTKVFTFPTGQNKVAKDWQQIANSDEMSRQFNLKIVRGINSAQSKQRVGWWKIGWGIYCRSAPPKKFGPVAPSQWRHHVTGVFVQQSSTRDRHCPLPY